MTNNRISVRLDRDTYRLLDEEVRSTGKSESEVVREALTEYLKRRPPGQSCLELARRHGLIGCAKALPADLSTNPEHFEGFGR